MNLETHLSEHDEAVKQVILRVSEVAKKISRGFATRQGVSDSSNIYGERQVAMDVWADELLISELRDSKLVRYLASEEQPDVLTFEDSTSDLGLAIDPLDGSSLIGVNLAVGTIVGIYRGNVLSPGEGMLGAMYVLYGPLLIVTHGGTMVNIVAWWIRMPLETLSDFSLRTHNTGITILVETEWGERAIERHNDVAHLHLKGLATPFPL